MARGGQAGDTDRKSSKSAVSFRFWICSLLRQRSKWRCGLCRLSPWDAAPEWDLTVKWMMHHRLLSMPVLEEKPFYCALLFSRTKSYITMNMKLTLNITLTWIVVVCGRGRACAGMFSMVFIYTFKKGAERQGEFESLCQMWTTGGSTSFVIWPLSPGRLSTSAQLRT